MRNFHFIFLTIFFALLGVVGQAAETLGLSGEWRFALDRNDAGIKENWAAKKLSDKFQLPGVLQAQGFGDEISTNTPWVLSLYDKLWFQRADYTNYAQSGAVKVPFLCQPPRHYLGAAWYQRDVEIPTNWIGRRVELFLERTRWETRAWLDDRLLGTNNSLCVPHEFEVGIVGDSTSQIRPGKHRLTVRVDNRMLMDYRPDAHAVSDSLGSTWNGIVGKIELRSTSLVWIEEARVSVDTSNVVTIAVKIGNRTGQERKAVLSLGAAFQAVPMGTNGAAAEFMIPFGDDAVRWDEFKPHVYNYTLRLDGQDADDKQDLSFGLRDFKAVGQDLVVNGRPTHLRGTHYGGDFPLTGYPSCDVEYWLKLFRTCKEWGLNHVRFHSFCPPEAAFTAADEVGIYLQIEPGMWNDISPGTPMEAMLYAETERILKAYGNHPSFVLMSASNEAKGRWKQALPKWVKHFREVDPRRLYTPDTGWSLIDEPGPVDGADYLAVHRIGQNLMRGESGWFGRDYARSMHGVSVPNIVHEVGQWCAYPDFDVIKKFTGYMQPGNFEIFCDSASANGVLERDKEFAFASGRFQLECYKEEIEANLRTPGLAGFQLLDLHDYVGQGTALVGLLDPFWESKGYVTASEFKKFCSPVVPLARLPKRVFTTTDKFEVPVEIANFGRAMLMNVPTGWRIVDSSNHIVVSGRLGSQAIPVGKNFALGNISADLSKLPAPAAYKLVVEIQNPPVANDWNFWLYPVQVSTDASADVLVTSSWDDAEKKLSSGGNVLFLPRKVDLDWSSPTLENMPLFWNRLMSPGWSRMLGLWCDTHHPALAGFPTDVNCDWQWTQIVNRARTMNLAKLPRGLKPIVSAIDDWNRNWKLGVVFEGRVGAGKLMVCTLDLKTDLDARPVARQLRRSLLDYMSSEKFQPQTEVAAADFRASLFDTLVMKKLGATASGSGTNANLAIDGDPNTFWQSGGGGRGKSADTRKHPHELVFVFTNAVAIDGVILMPRQNDRDHVGDVRGFKIETSDDGKHWATAATGELASSWSPQTIRFVQTIAARQLKFSALSGFGNDTTAALAELAVIYAGAKLPENTDDRGQYKRVRSTSSDVDEGGAR